MQRYDKYKDSGIDWLGEIPEHWELNRLKHIFKEKKKTLNFSLPAGSISFGKVVFKDDEKIPESTKATYQEVLEGDYLINPLNLNYDLISLRIALSEINVVVSSGYIVIQDIVELNRNYYKWLLHQYDVAYMKLLGSGVRQTISFNNIANSELPFPPLHEQQAIANFLDDKCEKIDAAVGLKELQIEKLRELRQITIHNAVTKGLCHPERSEGSITMKDSGIDWIGDIPEHWEVKRLKHVLKERNSRSQLGEEPILMMSQVYGLVLRKDFHEKEQAAKTTEGNKLVYPDDLVFNKLKPHLGVFFKNKIGVIGIVSPDYAVYYSDVLYDIVFLEYLFRTPQYITQFKIKSSGIVEGLIRLYTNELFSIYIVLPPVSEQKEIVSYLEEQTSKIDKAIAQKQEQIVKLKEYKQSLINEVVTGKIKVSA